MRHSSRSGSALVPSGDTEYAWVVASRLAVDRVLSPAEVTGLATDPESYELVVFDREILVHEPEKSRVAVERAQADVRRSEALCPASALEA